MKFKTNIYIGSMYQLIIVLIFFWLTRLVFIIHNAILIDVTSFNDVVKICVGGLRIDGCILAYSNSVFILMRFAPWPWAYNRYWIAISNWMLIIVNSISLLLNLADTAYFPFTGYRMSWQSFMNVATDPETFGVLMSYLPRFWWAYLAGIFSVALMGWLITRVEIVNSRRYCGPKYVLWIAKTIIFLLAGGFTFMCMRGWTSFIDRPLERATGVTLVSNIQHFPAVLNTPFSIFYSRKGDVLVERIEVVDPGKLQKLRNGVIENKNLIMNNKNLFVIIIESGGSIHSKIFNPVAGDTAYSKSMTFIDSLATVSLINRHMFASGRTSTQGITHIFSGMPYFGASYLVESPYVENVFDSPARLLAKEGYDTRFYYGCSKGNYHIDETAQLSGFKTTLSRESYDNDKEFDGKWGIWDKRMAEFVVSDLTNAYNGDTPFLASWFTITAHEPAHFPSDEDLKGYNYLKASPERAMEYTDRALRHFFDLARRQPWYENTIFVITSDHGQRNYKDFHTNNLYAYSHIPFIIYAPHGAVTPGVIDDMPMSQIDVPPTLLDLVGYNKPYVTFGTSMFNTQQPHYGIAESFGEYFLFGNKYMVTLPAPGKPISKVYDIKEKPYPQTPINNYDHAVTDSMANWFNYMMQDFSTRINDDNLSVVSR